MPVRRYWLMKSEPDAFSIEDLKRRGQSPWDGVRNYRARNFMKDQMAEDDLVLFYHSSTLPPGVAGIARVCSKAYPDPTQFDAKSKYFDAKSTTSAPRWWLVDVEFVERLPVYQELPALRACPELEGMMLLQKGTRLSIQPVDKKHFVFIIKQGQAKTKVR
jgi:predicted RNA-binding protein with PUA-like domain